MNVKPPSIKDVAKKAGVSIATVSNVFSGKKPVSDKLAQHVRSVADKLGYKINPTASVLRTGKSKVIGMLVPDLGDPFFTSLIRELEWHAKFGGYEIIVANSNDNIEIQKGRLEALLSWRPAGFVIVPCTDMVPEIVERACRNVPFVVADRFSEVPYVDTVKLDNENAGAIAAKHVTEQGHRHVVLAASDTGLAGMRDRCMGAKKVIDDCGGKAEVVELSPVPEKGAKLLATWVEKHEPPTAFIALTDMTTLAVLTYLSDQRIELGEDISLVGFDDYLWMSSRRTPITAVRHPVEEIGHSIWERLEARINGDSSPPQSIVHRGSLLVRASVKRIRQG